MSRKMFNEYCSSVSVRMAVELAIANGISKTQVELWTMQFRA